MKSRSVFTIVELLIVIVVIAILAAISVSAFSGMQVRAQNTVKTNELLDFAKLFKLYAAAEGNYPNMPNPGYCLGSGFPEGVGGIPACRNYSLSDPTYRYNEADSAVLMTLLGKYGSLPTSTKYPVGPSVGPYALFEADRVRLVTFIRGHGLCPEGTVNGWSGSAERQQCEISLMR